MCFSVKIESMNGSYSSRDSICVKHGTSKMQSIYFLISGAVEMHVDVKVSQQDLL